MELDIAKTKQKIDEIAKIIITIDLSKYDFESLLGGRAGVSLFLFFYANTINSEYYYEHAFEMLQKDFDTQLTINSSPTSLSRKGWLLSCLTNSEVIKVDLLKYFESIDSILFNSLIANIRKNNFDFLHGGLAIVLFFLSRKAIDTKTYNYLAIFVNELIEKKNESKDHEFKWASFINIKNRTEVYNISMSHGISSIIAVLSKLYKKDIEKKKTKIMIEGAVNYLLQQKLPHHQYISIFPNLALESMDTLYPSRLAWCYGDLGISVAIWHASQALNNKEWEKEAVNILLHTAKRRDLKENGVVDAGLCHGAAGIAHIFNRMYGYTGIEELKETSDYWFDQTLKMARFEDGLAGFKAWQGEDKGWLNEAGLLEGIAGIGLALISAVSDIEPAWDECLLLS